MRFAHCACRSNIPKMAEEMVRGTRFNMKLLDDRVLSGGIERMIVEPKASPAWMGRSSGETHRHFTARLTVDGVEFSTDEIRSLEVRQPIHAEEAL